MAHVRSAAVSAAFTVLLLGGCSDSDASDPQKGIQLPSLPGGVDDPIPMPAKNGATLENYNKVTAGMTEDQMLTIMSRDNCSVVSSGDFGPGYQGAGWLCTGGTGSAQFFIENQKVENKMQIGLR